MLTAHDRQAFDLHGLVKLPAAIDARAAGRMRDAVWSFLAESRGVDRHDPTTWPADRPTGFQPLTRSGALDALWAPAVDQVLEELLGPAAGQRRERGRLLMTMPQTTGWTVPIDGWHFDYTPVVDAADPRAVQVFALLADVRPGGGGTLVLTGSHRLVAGLSSGSGSDGIGHDPRPRAVRTELATRHPWLASLWSSDAAVAEDRAARFLGRQELVDGLAVEVIEVTGRAGDVFVMHSDCFHAIAPNSLRGPRLMCTSLVTRQPA